MAIEFPCSGCERRLSVPDEFAGKKASCPACGAVLVVPSAAAPEIVDAHVAPAETAAGAGPTAPGEVVAGAVVPADDLPTTARTDETRAAPLGSSTPPSLAPPAPPPVDTRSWSMRTPERVIYGPVSRAELEDWVRQGRVTADCELRAEGDAWRTADAVFPALAIWRPQSSPTRSLLPDVRRVQNLRVANVLGAEGGRPAEATDGETASRGETASSAPASDAAPDRGILILTLGLVGLFSTCPVFGVMAWVLGTRDLQEMRAGRMDVRGWRLTRAGRTLGMVVAALWVTVAVLITAWGLTMATS